MPFAHDRFPPIFCLPVKRELIIEAQRNAVDFKNVNITLKQYMLLNAATLAALLNHSKSQTNR